MEKYSTPSIEYDKLPPSIVDWIKVRLLQDETILFCVYYTYDQEKFTFYLLSNLRLILLDTNYIRDNHTHYYENHVIIFLMDIYKITMTRGTQGYSLNIRYGTNEYESFQLEQDVAIKFEVELLNAIKLTKLT